MPAMIRSRRALAGSVPAQHTDLGTRIESQIYLLQDFAVRSFWSGRRFDKCTFCSFPFDRCRWFGADVVDDAVDSGHFIDDPSRDPGQHVVRQMAPIGGHEILRVDAANDQGIVVRPWRHPSRRRSGSAAGRQTTGTFLGTSPASLISLDHNRVGLAQGCPVAAW